MGNPIYGKSFNVLSLASESKEQEQERPSAVPLSDERKESSRFFKCQFSVGLALILNLQKKKPCPPNPHLSETPPESPAHEAREEIDREATETIGIEPMPTLRLPPRPAAEATTTSTTMAAAAGAGTLSQSRVDSCGNLLDPGLVAFAEVSIGLVFLSESSAGVRT